jgi:hypothetical protein
MKDVKIFPIFHFHEQLERIFNYLVFRLSAFNLISFVLFSLELPLAPAGGKCVYMSTTFFILLCSAECEIKWAADDRSGHVERNKIFDESIRQLFFLFCR